MRVMKHATISKAASVGLSGIVFLGGLFYLILGCIALVDLPSHQGKNRLGFLFLDLVFLTIVPTIAWMLVTKLGATTESRRMRYAAVCAFLAIAGVAYIVGFYLLSTPVTPIPHYAD
jgi:hypothetical protein